MVTTNPSNANIAGGQATAPAPTVAKPTFADLANNPEAFFSAMYGGADTPLAQKAIARYQAQKERTAGLATLSQQLGGQASGYGFSWKGNKSADHHQMKVANILYDKGVRNLSDLGYSEDGKNLINKNTGQIVPFYKNRSIGKDGRGQIGWNAAGKGLTNYYVQPDAQGNPVFTPKWKSNAPGGIGGFLLKAAPVLTNFIPGMTGWGSALINAGLTGLQGGNVGDMLKSGAMSAIGNKIGNFGANAATASLPMVGTAGITNAIADAAGGALSGAAVSGMQGRDILSGALTGATGSLVNSGAQGIAGLIPKQVTGVQGIDRALPAVTASTIKNVARGQDVGSALTGSVLTAAGQEATRQLPNTGFKLVDAALRSGVQMGTNELASALNTRAGSTNVAPQSREAAQAPSDLASTYKALLPFLQASRAPEVPQAASQQVASADPFSTLNLQQFFARQNIYAKGGAVNNYQSLQQLLAQLRSSGKIA